MTTLDPRQATHRWPQLLPDGRHFLYYARGVPEATGIYLGSLDSKESVRLTAADSGGVYAPPGWLLWVRAGTLLAQRLDLQQRALAGEPVTVADAPPDLWSHGAEKWDNAGQVMQALNGN